MGERIRSDRGTPTIKQKWTMTPMAYVPVDYLPFYIPKSLYEDLPQESMIEEVGCKVKIGRASCRERVSSPV